MQGGLFVSWENGNIYCDEDSLILKELYINIALFGSMINQSKNKQFYIFILIYKFSNYYFMQNEEKNNF